MQVAGIWLQGSRLQRDAWLRSFDATASARYFLVRACERELGNQHHLSGGG